MNITLDALHDLTEEEQGQDSARSDDSGTEKDLLKPGSVTPDTEQGRT
jgi:hypothetical protein